MKRVADIFRGRILDVTDKSYTVELTGDSDKLDAFIAAIEPVSFWKRCALVPQALGVANEFSKSDQGNSNEGLLRQGL